MPSQPPKGRLFGFECEVARGAQRLIKLTHEMGLSGDNHLHEYHCSCDYCSPMRAEYAITGQRDCTVDGEFITRALPYGSDDAEECFSQFGEALLKARAETGLNAGNHVHVNRQDFTPADDVRLYRLFIHYQDDLSYLAKSSFPEVRGYNEQVYEWSVFRSETYETRKKKATQFNRSEYVTTDKCSWLAFRNHTYEFRLWNSTRTEWRLRGHVALSIAMVEAAKAGIDIDLSEETRPFVQVLEPFISDDGWTFITRQSPHLLTA